MIEWPTTFSNALGNQAAPRPSEMDAMVSEPEPMWRQILNWGCVVYFLGLPGIAIFYGVTHFTFGDPSSSNISNFLRDFHFTVSALVAAIAGLNSFDRRTKVTDGKPPPNPPQGKQ
jgi:hypothetical protein